MNKLFVFVLITAVITITGCKKDSDNPPITTDLLKGAVEYTGAYPAPATITYNDAGTVASVEAYPGQALVFFQSGVSESDAEQLITSNGGTVLAKIPVIGYYFVSVNGSQFSSFLTSMNGSSQMAMAFPHVTGTLSAGVTILDGCDIQHGVNVEANLEYCGGIMEKCVNIIGTDEYTLWNKIVQGIATKANTVTDGAVLINISASGFNRYSPTDPRKWNALTLSEQLEVSKRWLTFMKGLYAIANFPENMRKNVVITVASGNGDMPITGLMNQLKQNAKMADILDKNVIVVSNTSSSIGKGNYSDTDPDVVVVDTSSTPDAYGGTSYSAPCALGLVQRLVNEKGLTPASALQIIKTVSALDPKRVVRWEKILELLGTARFVGGGYTFVDTTSQIITGVTVAVKNTVSISSIELLWRPASGQYNGQDYGFAYLTINAHVQLDCLSGCDTTMQFNVSMTQDSADCMGNSVNGIASAPVNNSYYLMALNGTRSGNTINGYLYLPNVTYADRDRLNIVLQKQE